MQAQPATPFVYEVVEPATRQTTVLDVVLGAASVAGALALVAVVFGVVFATVMFVIRRRRAGARAPGVQLGLAGYAEEPQHDEE